MSSVARPFLALTKFQEKILKGYVEDAGFAEGVQRLYKRLQELFKDREHPAMSESGEVARDDNGHVHEWTPSFRPTEGNSYEHKGAVYTYETRAVVRNGNRRDERRPLLPSRAARLRTSFRNPSASSGIARRGTAQRAVSERHRRARSNPSYLRRAGSVWS